MAYTKHRWVQNELITTDRMNFIEDGIEDIYKNSDVSAKNLNNFYMNIDYDVGSRDTPLMRYFLNPSLIRNAVMQSITYSNRLGQWFISQADVSDPEGFVLQRIAANGDELSQMWFSQLGHGVNYWIKDSSVQPIVFVTVENKLYKTPYNNNATVTLNDLTYVIDLPDENGAITEHNGMISYLTKNETTENWILTCLQMDYDVTNNSYANIQKSQSITLDSDQINDNNLLQGVAMLKKSQLTGNISDTQYVIMVLSGTSGFTHHMYSYEYDGQSISLVGDMKNPTSVVYPNINKDMTGWNDYCEPEGMTVVDNEDGVGIFIGVSTGPSNKRQHYIYGIATNELTTKLSDDYLSYERNKTTRKFIPNYISNLYQVTQPGDYNIQNTEFDTFSDLPDFVSQTKNPRYWLLKVRGSTIYGDLTQELISLSTNTYSQSYIRDISYKSSLGYGASYNPSNVGYWKWNSQQNNYLISGIQRLGITKMRDMNMVGAIYYVSTDESSTIDLEGSDSYLKGKAFKVEVVAWSGAGTSIIQKVTRSNSSVLSTIQRVLTQCKPFKNGPNLVTTVANTPWTYTDGTTI